MSLLSDLKKARQEAVSANLNFDALRAAAELVTKEPDVA